VEYKLRGVRHVLGAWRISHGFQGEYGIHCSDGQDELNDRNDPPGGPLNRFWIVFLCFVMLMGSSVSGEEEAAQLLIDFRAPDTDVEWRVVDDGVMGGLSKGNHKHHSDHLQFYGTLSLENNGGFSSIRMYEKLDLGGCKGVRLRVRGDGRTYQVRFQADARLTNNRWVSFRSEFATEAGVWIDVDVPFDSLKQSFHGRELSGYDFDPKKIQMLGFLLADKNPGAFDLSVQWVKTY